MKAALAKRATVLPDASVAAATPRPHVRYPEDIQAFIPEEDWRLYGAVIRRAKALGLSFAVSGGFATSFYTGFWRNTKDMDLCVRPADRDAMVAVTREAGLHDLYDEKPYDRGWIYRATHEGLIVDIIWQLANYQGVVDDAWLTGGADVTLYGDTVRLVSPEELIWSKIHIFQRERCDFPDIANVLYATGATLDWSRLIARLAGEERLLGSVLLLFSWLAPGRAQTFPEWIWPRLGIERPPDGPDRDDDRIRRVDSRAWFTAS
jgi:hypothetical protein